MTKPKHSSIGGNNLSFQNPTIFTNNKLFSFRMRRRCRINTSIYTNAKTGKQSFKTHTFASLCKIYTPRADKKTINFATFSFLLAYSPPTPLSRVEESKNKNFLHFQVIIPSTTTMLPESEFSEEKN